MEEFEPKRKSKIIDKEFIAKYSYVFVLAILLIGGISYGYTFFTENRKIASGSITTANLTINFSNRNINATNLSIPNNIQEGLSEYSKSLTITNQTAIDGKVKLTISRSSGIALTNMRYAIVVNGAIQEIDDVPASGEILSTAIMGNEVLDVEIRLWPKTTYSGSDTTFVGIIEPKISYLGNTATDTTNLTGKYVNFNGNEVWQIVKTENDRLVLTRQADYSGATSRTNSNRYNPSLTFNDNSLITSVSTDNKNVYLAKTTKITGGTGTQADPYNLVNNDFREEDKKVIAIITYKDDSNTTVGTQRIYYNETNYVSQVINSPDFDGWTDGTNNYSLGDTISINSDLVLNAKYIVRVNAHLDAGKTINAKIKSMVANTTATHETIDNTLKKIEWGNELPNNFVASADNTISSSTSEEDIYMWYDSTDAILYLYTEANGKIYLDEDSSYLFSNLRVLEQINILSRFDTSEVEDISHMFHHGHKLSGLNLSSFDTSNVTNMEAMFYECESLTSLNVTNFNTSNVENMAQLFRYCSNLETIDVSHFNTAKVINMTSMFSDCNKLTELNLSNFVTTNVEKFGGMFNNCYALATLNISSFDTSKATIMSLMFSGCSSLTSLNLSHFNTSNVAVMAYMFNDCIELVTLNISSFNTAKVTNMASMFAGCKKLTSLNVSNFVTTNVTDMRLMFQKCEKLTTLDISNFNTSNVEYMYWMFNGCLELTTITFGSNFSTAKVEDFNYMFGVCPELTSLDLSTFDTSIAKNMNGMFAYCQKLTELDLSGFNTSNVTNMESMFDTCDNLEVIYVSSSFVTTSVTKSDYMFYDCLKLVGGAGSAYRAEYMEDVDKTMAHIDGGQSNPGYFTDIANKPTI